MKIIQIKKRFAKIAPRKIRLVGRELKNLSIEKASRKLLMIDKYGARILETMLKEARQILEDKNLTVKNFHILSVRVDQGPTLKRHLPRSRGRVSPIKKYLSHIILELVQKKPKTQN